MAAMASSCRGCISSRIAVAARLSASTGIASSAARRSRLPPARQHGTAIGETRSIDMDLLLRPVEERKSADLGNLDASSFQEA